MILKENNFAYIDAANLHKGVADLGWKLDYKRFRLWLRDKYHIQTAYLFIGLVPGNKDLYTNLQEMGYVLVYKEVTYDGAGKVRVIVMLNWSLKPLLITMKRDRIKRSLLQATEIMHA